MLFRSSKKGLHGFLPSSVTAGYDEEVNLAFNSIIQSGTKSSLSSAVSAVARVAFQNPEATLYRCCHMAVVNLGAHALLAQILQQLPGLRSSPGDTTEMRNKEQNLLCRCHILPGSSTISGMLRLVFNIGINNCSAMADINKSTTSLRYLDSTHNTVNSNVHEKIVMPILLWANTLGNDSRFEYSCSARPRIILITRNCPLLIVVISTSINIVEMNCIGNTNGLMLLDVK